MRIAFIIQVHKQPAQLERLLKRLAHPQVDCYVHIDAKCSLPEWESVLSLPQVYLVKQRANVTWAGWGIIQASLNGMNAVLNTGIDYAWVTLLSGQDYPLQPIGQIIAFLQQQKGRQFLNVISEEALRPMMSKMEHYHFVEYNFPGKYRLGRLLTAILPRRKAPLGLQLYCGSAWWTLSLDCVRFCVTYEQQHPALRKYFKLTWGADEFIFQTILMNNDVYRSRLTDYLHYIDWSAGKEHPKVLGIEDIEVLRQSGKLFARKFDFNTPVLDRLDALMDKPVDSHS
ncbi:beta-1,6-N-acetylglucosaminyltransferase [Chitinophaga qingshengii]|uniref:Peptide O-xylosyltransferase n=1 Tax=Chitinophaga qingshengii TaxID=1569794 RepID=A0ABR7TH21_9BACT|nr:beta-1,6-N-acetylglucosaminyltransferase [Chitinophaga qingshengii]MBC9928782.1 glycosyl transferase [Chitinophaga qingshengii]